MPSEKERAAFAWAKVQDCSEDYENLAKSGPALVMNNGLMQALAFFASRGKKHHTALNEHIFEWLAIRFKEDIKRGQSNKENFHAVMDFLNKANSLTYREATEEVLELLRWIRHFASAVVASKL